MEGKQNTFHIELCQDSKKTVLIFMLIYGLGIGVALSSRRHYRRGEEHGSAKWGSASVINRKYRAKDPEANKVFTKHIRMGLDGRKHRRNLNTVVVGGSGSGKSRLPYRNGLSEPCGCFHHPREGMCQADVRCRSPKYLHRCHGRWAESRRYWESPHSP